LQSPSLLIDNDAPQHYYARSMRIQIFLALILLTFSFVACQPKQESETREKALSRGFAMMDDGKNDEAIEYFAKLAQQDPHFHVKLAWASAYANRAGVRIEKIYSFAVLATKTQDFKAQFQGLTFDRQTEELIKNINTYLARWNKIPNLNAEARGDLQKALDVLSPDQEPAVRVYAAILRLVLLKSVTAEGFENFRLLSNEKICGDQLNGYFDWGLQILNQLAILSEDLEKSFPKNAGPYRETKEKVRRFYALAKKLPKPAEDQCFTLARH
jgi:tetratricopeptide (TPR) repeat protein